MFAQSTAIVYISHQSTGAKQGAEAMQHGDAPVTAAGESASEPILLRVEEAARLLSLSRTTVYELMERGELPSIKYGAARRIPRTALEEWVAQRLAAER
jgi:excisionase family DNA binding protein